MSRLLDKLEKVKKTAPQPMGFRASRGDTKESSMILIAGLPASISEKANDFTAGADAVYLKADSTSLTAKAVGEVIQSIQIPCGISIADTGKAKVDTYLQAGCDFLVIPSESPVTSLPDEGDTGTVIQIDPSLDDSLARAVNNMPVDVVITTKISGKGSTLTWEELLIVQRIALLISKPVIVPVSTGISAEELKAIRDAGVEGIIVEVNVSEPGKIKEISEAIRSLPPKVARKHEKTDVLLPRGSTAESLSREEEDDDDYE